MSIIILLLIAISTLLADTQTIAISYFDNTSGLEEYNPLSKGLADMLITDLSNVKSIQIVEREKLESLLKEIELGESKFMDESTAQKLGKGLGASYMLTGSYLIMGETMRIDARLVNVATGEVSMGEEITGEKNTFFELEKDLVQKLISALNLSLSKSEERRVKKVQTESFDSFNAYSTALDSYDKGEYEESQTYLEKAVEIDADFEIAWDKLDALQEQLEQLLAARKIKLSTEIIKIMDDLVKNDKNNCETFLNMYDNKYSYLMYHLWDDEKYDGTLYDEDHKDDIIKAFNEMIKIYEYMDLKKYPLNLCDDINSDRESTNSYKYIWEINGIEDLLVDLLTFEFNSGDRINIEKNNKKKDIKTVIDEMIIFYEEKLIKAFPNRHTYHAERSLEAVKRAIHRKQNPDIYNAYRWIENTENRKLSNYFLSRKMGRKKDIETIIFMRIKDPVTIIPKELGLIPDLKSIGFSSMVMGSGGSLAIGSQFVMDCDVLEEAKRELSNINIFGYMGPLRTKGCSTKLKMEEVYGDCDYDAEPNTITICNGYILYSSEVEIKKISFNLDGCDDSGYISCSNNILTGGEMKKNGYECYAGIQSGYLTLLGFTVRSGEISKGSGVLAQINQSPLCAPDDQNCAQSALDNCASTSSLSSIKVNGEYNLEFIPQKSP